MRKASHKGMTKALYALAASFIIALLQLSLATSHASEAEKYANLPPIPDVDEVIQRCEHLREKLVEEDHSTMGMRNAALEEALCLRAEVLENMVVLAGEERRDEVNTLLEMIHTGHGKLYWMLFNGINPCFWNRGLQVRTPGCGSQFHSIHNTLSADVYEDLLRLVIKQRETHDW